MIKPPQADRRSAGAQAWELVYDLLHANKPFMAAAMSEFDLTPQQGWAIKLLSGPKALAMSDLAEMMGCDASNITSIVDRLEARGFVERRAAASDRRVKELVLTPCGRELYERVAERMEQPPPMIDNLSESDKEQLRDILRRALDSVEL